MLVSLVAAACSFVPPPSCEEDIGGVADQASFDRYFSAMALVSQATGLQGPRGEAGSQFNQGDSVTIEAAVREGVGVRACIQPMSGGSELVFDDPRTMAEGQSSFELGTFDVGSYVVRVIADGNLAKNLPFQVQ